MADLTPEEKQHVKTQAALVAARWPQFYWDFDWMEPWEDMDPASGRQYMFPSQFQLLAQSSHNGLVSYAERRAGMSVLHALIQSGHLIPWLDGSVEEMAKELMEEMELGRSSA